MFSRSNLHAFRRGLVTAIAATLTISLAATVPAQAAPAGERLRAQTEQLDKHGGPVQGKGFAQNRLKNATLPAPVWPGASSTLIDLGGTRQRVAGKGVQAGNSPVFVDPAGGPVSQVDVKVLDRAKVPAVWRNGLLVQLGAPAPSTSGKVNVSVDYSSFQYAFGGDWASRLRLWELPQCALSTPDKPGCKAKLLPTSNKSGVLTAPVNVAPTGAHSDSKAASLTSFGTMIAVAAAASGSSGDFTATSLSPSASWSAGGSSGDFSWTYPLRLPPAPGGSAPSINLAYSSSSVDGRSEATNAQPSWIGEGFEYSAGYIERRYVPCADDMKNGANNTEKTGDMCWRSDNATLTLNGGGGELLHQSGSVWRQRAENGSKIEKLTGASNGDNDGEYWKVTTNDGTQYFFGRHSLPGGFSGTTNSAWTLPVFGNHSGEPCRQTAYASSSCTQVWRWNLDYVIDPRGNTTTYWYEKETNQYARNNTATDKAGYVRGGVLKHIDYGTYHRTAAEHGVDQVSATPVATAVFDTADRCLTDCWNGADAKPASWSDVPWDQNCKTTAADCGQNFSPTFWTAKRLSKITTKVWDTTIPTPAWQDVESWALTQAFPSPGDGTHAGLWLDSIVHAGHVGGTVTLAPVTFEPVSMHNRVLTGNNTTDSWLRISNIITETGARLHVDYSLRECSSSNLPSAAHTNAMRCYPTLSPDLSADPSGDTLKTDWWHKYTVSHVAEEDVRLADGHQSPTKHTWYEYAGAPAWHFADDDGLSQPKYKTWGQFRGYGTVKVRTGEDPAQQTLEVTHFLRGMHGDKATPTGGTRTVQVGASLGSEQVFDEDQFSGMTREQVVYNGDESKPISKTVMVPWRSNATASRTVNGDLVEARYTNTAATYSATALGVDASRGWRVTRLVEDYDPTYGTTNWSRVDGDIAVTGDEKCTTFTYNRNLTKNILTLVKRVTAVALPCGTNPSSAVDVLSDVQNYYDGASSVDTEPKYGSVSKVELLKDWIAGTGTVWQTVSQVSFDSTGRPVSATDVKGLTSTTAFTPAVGGPVTKVTTTSPAPFNWVSTVDIAPYWGSSLKEVDPNGKIKGEATYDALGRVAKVWRLGWSKASNPTKPSAEYTYSLPANRDTYTYVATKELNAKGNYVTSYKILDGLLRQRQSQSISLNGDGSRVVTDTLYDSFGRASTLYAGHAEPGAPSGTLWWEPEWSVPAVSKTEYDRANRTIASVNYTGDGVTNLVQKWRTSSAYEGDLTKTSPPAGAVPTTVVTDIDGRTIELRQHNTSAGVGGAYVAIRYQYNRKNQLAKVIDPDGNEWTYKFDTKGREIESVDPDSGKLITEYNDANEKIKTTDARGKVLYYAYDEIGRPKQLREGSATGPLRSEWKYDKLYSGQTGFRGHLAEAIRYEPAGSANAYKWQVRQFDGRYQPGGINIVVPAIETGLNATYAYGFGYSGYTGAQTDLTYPAAGDLPTEKVTTDYDPVTGLPVRMDTNWGLQTGTMVATWYTAFGETSLTTRKMPGSVYVDDSVEYDTYTRRIARTTIQTETGTGTVSDRNYTYDLIGNITSIKEKPQVGAEDTQCFSYDNLIRLSSAWTPKSGVDCAISPTTANLGGPAPYWTDWTFNNTGSRAGEVSHAAAGDTTRTYGVPTGGAGVVRPHTVNSMTTTVPSQSPVTVNYTYDQSGNTICRPTNTAANNCSTGTNSQTIAWDYEGRVSSISAAGQTIESNVYDANGTRLIRRDATGSTLYLPGQEIRREGTVNKATRYYAFGEGVCASRNAGGLTWQYSDHHGTQQIAVKSDTQAVTIRQQTPYGSPRGTSPTWANNKGFVGGDNDPSGLVNIGARRYDAQLGRFISDDPVTDITDSQQMHGYAYSSNNPITYSDPTGLKLESGAEDTGCAKTAAECQGDAAADELDRLKRQKEAAEKARKAALKDMLLEAGLALLLDALGIQDILDCFGKGDLMACGSMLMGALPVGRVFKLGKALWKAIDRGFSAYKAWKKTVAAAEAFLSKADDLIAMAQKKVDDLAEGLGGSCTHSFDPDTPVLMADGTAKPIKDIELGDKVTATDPETGETTSQPVTLLHENLDLDLTDVTVSSSPASAQLGEDEGKGDRTTRGPTKTVTLQTTQHHPFWDATTESWINAADLKPGESTLVGPNGQIQFVVAVRNFDDAKIMRDLTVSNFHTYYVLAAAAPVLVHNCLGKGAPEGKTPNEAADIRSNELASEHDTSRQALAAAKDRWGIARSATPFDQGRNAEGSWFIFKNGRGQLVGIVHQVDWKGPMFEAGVYKGAKNDWGAPKIFGGKGTPNVKTRHAYVNFGAAISRLIG